ncbi:hypothetical protein AB8P51_11375 [Muriicola sp. SD30]|uniref:hypothetical protein n=1 Tax=Muriicola sp. SD30 TaxID=3240936 RepID=UPI00350EC026
MNTVLAIYEDEDQNIWLGLDNEISEIIFLLDNEVNGSVSNMASLSCNKDFSLIMNIAMEGSYGGAIDRAFTQSSMEVDYIRVYQ